MLIKKYKKLKYLLLSGLIVSPTLVVSSIILVQKLDKKYLLFDNKIFSSTQALNNYLNKNKETSFLKMDAKSFYFDNQVFNTTQQFHEYLVNKFNIDEKLTNKIPGDYTINGAGELSKQVLLDNNDKALKVYQGKNGLAYLNRKDALDTFTNYKKTYTIEGESKEFGTPYEIRDYLTNVTLKNLEKKDPDNKDLVYKYGGLMLSKEEIKALLRKNIKNGFEYQGKIFSDYNYKEFLNYFQNLDPNIINENITDVLNPDKSAYWVNLDDTQFEGYFIGPKYVETSSELSTEKMKEGFQTIDSFTPNLFSGFVSLSILNEVINLDYKSKTTKIKWNGGLENYIKVLREGKIISPILWDKINSLLFSESWSHLKQIVQDSTTNLEQIDGDKFSDFHRLLVVLKRIIVPARIYSGLNPDEIEKVLKELLIEILTSNHQQNKAEEQNFFLSLTQEFENLKLEEIIDLFLNPADFYQANESKETALKIIKKVDEVVNGIMKGVKDIKSINKSIDDLNNKYNNSNKNEKELASQRQNTNSTIQDALEKDQETILNEFDLENNTSEDYSPLGIGELVGIIKWVSLGWEMLNTFSFVSIKTLEYKIDQYQSVYYVAPTYKIPLLNIESDVKLPNIEVTKLSQSLLDYMIPPKTTDKNEVTKVYELEGKYYLEWNNVVEVLRSKIYLTPEKYIPCKKIFSSIFEEDEGHFLPDWLVNAKIIKKDADREKPNAMEYSDYLTALADEKEKYVEHLFKQYFEPHPEYYFLDGLGNYFSTKEEAIASVNFNLLHSDFEDKVSYSYVTRSGKKFETKSEVEIIDFIQKNELIESKTIMNTDLIKTRIYDQISDYSNIYFSVFELDYYGDKKYFASDLQLWNYLLTKLDYQINYYKLDAQSLNYKDYYFKSSDELMSWVQLNTKRINSFQTKGKEIINDEK